MRYIKTYESFNVNETMDMFTMPVDPIKGSLDVYKEIGNFIKSKLTDLVKYLGDKVEFFIDKLSSLVEMIIDEIGTGFQKVADNIERSFGSATDGTSIAELSFSKVKSIIEDKFKPQIDRMTKYTPLKRSDEGYYWEPSASAKKEIHKEQESGEGNLVTSLPKDSGPVQGVLAILQNIFGVNIYACGVPLALVLSLIFGSMGMTAVVSMLASFVVSFIALVVIVVSRKLVYKIEHGD